MTGLVEEEYEDSLFGHSSPPEQSRRRGKTSSDADLDASGPAKFKHASASGSELGKGPVMIVFGAPWCPVNEAVCSAVRSASSKCRRGTKIYYVDIDEHPHLADRWRIQALPCVVSVEAGAELARLVGTRVVSETDRLAEALAPRKR